MRLSSHILFLGWWLTRQWASRGQPHSRPSISVSPSGMVALGEEVTIHCKMENKSRGKLSVIKKESPYDVTKDIKEAEHFETVFSIAMASQSDGGIYWCRFCSHQLDLCSDYGEPAYINITDPSLPKPSIKMVPRAPGENVTIECQGPENGLIFAVYKSGEQIASRDAEPERNTAEFLFNMVSSEDDQSYTCQYHHRRNPFVWSEPSDSVEIVLRAGSVITIWACGAAALLLLALLLFAFVLYRKRRKGSLASEEDQPVSVPLEPDAGEDPDDPDGVSYAELSHQSMKIKQAVNPGRVPDSCVYASVAKDRIREGQ